MKRRIMALALSCLMATTLGLVACQPPPPLETGYVNEEYGFSIKYPAEYAEEPPRGANEVFRARPPDRLPLLSISILGTEEDDTLVELKDTFKAAVTFAGGGDVEFVFEKEITLPDNITPAYELEMEYQFKGYELKTLYLWTVTHDKWFLVSATTTVDSWPDDKAEIKAMVHTFTAPTWTPEEGPTTFTADVPMRDGKTLPAFVVLPGETGSYPIIFIYTIGSARVYRSGIVMTEDDNRSVYGPDARAIYGFVFVNRRGMHESKDAYYEGSPTQGEDGADIVKWIASQPWSNGKIGMTGDGADGSSQYIVAAERPEDLTAIAPEEAPGLTENYFRFYRGGVLKEANFRMATEYVPGLWDTIVANPQMMDSWWDLLVANRPKAADINIPVVVVNGWWDHSVGFIFNAYEDLRTQSPYGDKTKLIIGPWTHWSAGDLEQGELEYPKAVEEDKAYMRRFHDYWLRGIDDGIYDEPPIYYYQMGEEVWKFTSTWPPPGTSDTKYYLRATGQLSPTAPAEVAEGPNRYIYDPNDPSPAIGGPFNLKSYLYPDIILGPAYQDNEVIAGRDDYLIYDTPVLTEDLEVAGTPRLRLYIESDRPDTDIVIRLCDYDPNGPDGKKTLLVTIIPQRMRYRESWTDPSWMEPGKVYEVDIKMDPIAYTWKKGHQVRIIVTSSSYPLYAINPNNKNHFIWDESEPLVAEVKVWNNSSYPSHLILPVKE